MKKNICYIILFAITFISCSKNNDKLEIIQPNPILIEKLPKYEGGRSINVTLAYSACFFLNCILDGFDFDPKTTKYSPQFIDFIINPLSFIPASSNFMNLNNGQYYYKEVDNTIITAYLSIDDRWTIHYFIYQNGNEIINKSIVINGNEIVESGNQFNDKIDKLYESIKAIERVINLVEPNIDQDYSFIEFKEIGDENGKKIIEMVRDISDGVYDENIYIEYLISQLKGTYPDKDILEYIAKYIINTLNFRSR